jgi:hypothetical protein
MRAVRDRGSAVSAPPEFLRAAGKPHRWLLSAEHLLNAADIIWKRAERQRRTGGRRLPSGLVVKTLRKPLARDRRSTLRVWGRERAQGSTGAATDGR